MIYHPVSLKDSDESARPIWSAQVELPAEIDSVILRYTDEDAPTYCTVVIHCALYAYRRQFWTRE